MINKALFELLEKKKKYIFINLFLHILVLLANIGFTFFICKIINDIYINNNKLNDLTYILWKLNHLVFFLDIRYISNLLINKFKNKITQYLKNNLRIRLYEKLLELGNLSFNKELTESKINQLTLEGIEQLDLYYTLFMPQFFYSLIAPLILFSFTVYFNYKVSMILIFAVPLIPLSIVLFAKKAKKTVNKYLDKYYELGNIFLDGLKGIHELKINNASDNFYKKVESSSEKFRKATMKVLSIQLFSITIMDLIAFGASSIGIFLALKNFNSSNISNLLFFTLFIILMAVEFFLPLRLLGSAFHISLNGVNSGKAIFKILNMKTLNWGNIKINNINKIDINNLKFSYLNNNIPNLEIDNLEIKVNEVLAITGPSGAGKSTLTKLLKGDYNLPLNTIMINNDNLFNLNKESYFKNFALINNSSHLFNDTIKNNFLLANPNISDDEIIKYLKLVNLDEYASFEKINYLINESNNNISGGEKQRIILAINLSLNKSFFIFDEATSSIDYDSEKIIMDLIFNLKNKIIIIISHRLNILKRTTNILYIEDAKIKEKGSYNQLINQRGSFYNLSKKQSELESFLIGDNYEK